MMARQHKLTLVVDADRIVMVCDQGDLFQVLGLGGPVTPTEAAKAADEHWGKPLGFLA